MNNKIIVRVAEGLGNQMFMYANAYSLAARNQCTLLIDDESGFYKKKNRKRGRRYNLDSFLIEAEIVSNKFKFNTPAKNILRKFLKIINFFSKKKKFILEKCFKNKKTKFENLSNLRLNEICYVEGHYESEKYFLNYSDKIKEQFTINNNKVNNNNFFISKIKSVNSVSIHFRKHRFTEEINEKKKNYKIFKTNEFENLTLDYINNGIRYFKNKVLNPVFFLWCNDFNGLENQFSKDIVFVKNENLIEDFNLFSFCQHFIVGPSTFHWWGAWLNKNLKKICLRPKNELLNPSNNLDFWPDRWIPI
jgi:hypothetical protein